MNSKLNSALDALKKNGIRIYGNDDIPKVERIKTGSLMLDRLLNGGVPTRRITQFFGKPESFKSSMSYYVVNNALTQYPDSVAVILDLECRYTPEWASKFIDKENLERIIVLREEFVEDAGNSINKLITQLKDIHISIIVIDSIAAANTARYDNGDMRKMEVAGAAMGISKLVRALVQIADKNNIAILVLNQLREDLNAFGPSIGRTNGGYQLKHAISDNILFKTLGQTDTKALAGNNFDIKNKLGDTEQIAVGVGFKVIKGANWSCSAKTLFYRKATENNDFGFDVFNEVVNIAIANEVIKIEGVSYIHPLFPLNEKKGINAITDKKPMIAFLKDNPDIFNKIKQSVEDFVEITEEGEVEDC